MEEDETLYVYVVYEFYSFFCGLLMEAFKDDNRVCNGDCNQGRNCDCNGLRNCESGLTETDVRRKFDSECG